MKKSRVSINDIASRLKISKTTVSFILNGKAKEKRISDDLAEKVQALVKELGYQPNQMARSLRTGRTRIIGLMVENISDPFFGSIAKHIEEIAYAQGYKIIYCSTENNAQRALDYLQMFQHLGVDGYIIAAPPGIDAALQDLVKHGKEIVLFDRQLPGLPADYVVVNNRDVCYAGIAHLITQGYRAITFVTLVSSLSQMQERQAGYREAMEDHGLTAQVIELAYTADGSDYVCRMEDLYAKGTLGEAVFFSTNYLGASGVEALVNMQVAIPQDMAVVSFDDRDLFRIHRPSITAIEQPVEQLATALINTLLDNLKEGKTQHPVRTVQGVVLPAVFRERNSSAARVS